MSKRKILAAALLAAAVLIFAACRTFGRPAEETTTRAASQVSQSPDESAGAHTENEPSGEQGTFSEETTKRKWFQSENSGKPSSENEEKVILYFQNGCEVTAIKSYDGPFFENGRDETISGATAVVVRNPTDTDIEFFEFELIAGKERLEFFVTALFSGQSVLVPEKNGAKFIKGEEIIAYKEKRSVPFAEKPSLHADKLEIGVPGSVMNVRNISKIDITSDIYVYYKAMNEDGFFGGKTFRAKVSGGLKAGEIRQIPAENFKKYGCKAMFVTYAD